MNRYKAGGSAATAATAVLATDAAGLLHELQVHQYELETQNRELRHAQLELATARDRYRDLYDLAPVGYLSLDCRGRILESNLTAARLLGIGAPELRRRPLSAFMVQGDADRWHLHVKQAFRHIVPWRIELNFRRADGAVFAGQLDGAMVACNDEPPNLRVTLTDVTLHRLADADRRAALQVVADQEADRRRLARELHDDLGQRLSALKMNLAARPRQAVSEGDMAAIVTAIDDAVASVRRMTSDLRPLMLDDLGLAAAIEALARRSARQYQLKLRLHLTVVDPPPGDFAAVTLYRLLQAGLPLLAGQPDVTGLRVDLHDEPDAHVLALQSQLNPTAPAKVTANSNGRWTALRETAHLMGCALEVATLRSGGERVTFRMPMPHQSAEG